MVGNDQETPRVRISCQRRTHFEAVELVRSNQLGVLNAVNKKGISLHRHASVERQANVVKQTPGATLLRSRYSADWRETLRAGPPGERVW